MVLAAWSPTWATYDATQGEPWFGFEAVRELAGLPPQLLLVPLPGHTRGHTGVAVHAGERWLLHAGDAYFFRNEMDPLTPRCTPSLNAFQKRMQVDGTARLANQEGLRELVRDHRDEVTVFSAHDAVELSHLTKAAGAGTRRRRKSATVSLLA